MIVLSTLNFVSLSVFIISLSYGIFNLAIGRLDRTDRLMSKLCRCRAIEVGYIILALGWMLIPV